jgi:hypothetical protein
MVVTLDLERDRLAVTEIEDAGVLARPLQNSRALARETLQEVGRMLVPAVLGPEEREHRELEVVRLPTEQRPDTVELPVRQAERAVEKLVGDAGQTQEFSLPPASDASFAAVAPQVHG